MSAVKKLVIITISVIALAFVVFIVTQYQPRSPKNTTVVKQVQAKKDIRRITASKFVKQLPKTITKTPKEEAPSIEVPKAEEISVPEEVPTAQSSDDKIRAFLDWLLSLDREDSSDEREIDDSNVEEQQVDYDREKQLIESVIWEQWKRGYETYDVERYMSSIWEDDFFYTSDVGTPADPSDDIILRGGQRERESTIRIFNKFTKNIELNLSPRSGIEFLSDTIAMVEYDYEVKFSQPPSPEDKLETYHCPSNMIIILERRENSEGKSEWRILEWYDYAQKPQ